MQEYLFTPRSSLDSQTSQSVLNIFKYSAPEKKSAREVLVLPNGYGMLAYAQELCLQLPNNHNCNVVGVNCSGQGNSNGELSVLQAAIDIKNVINQLKTDNNGKKITLIAHCTGMYPLLHLASDANLWKNIQRIIIYGYLANPEIHINRFLEKASNFNVRLNEKYLDSKRLSIADYEKLPIPYVLIHPTILSNRIRATSDELKTFKNTRQLEAIHEPDFGYNIANFRQKKSVSNIVSSYIVRYLN